MKTWGEIKTFLFEHRTDQHLQFHVIQWNMSNRGCLVDNATDEVVADTVIEAAAHLRRAGKPIRYISCQTCHKPAGDQYTVTTGMCHNCASELIAAGHRREAEKEAKQQR